jgi:rhodanese-related sulfurtransferase
MAPGILYAGCGSCGGEKGHSHQVNKEGAQGRESVRDMKSGCKGNVCALDSKNTAQGEKEKAKEAAEISTTALETMLRAGSVIVLDARTGKYDDGNRIPGADSLSPDASAKEAAAKIPSKDSLVVTYCSNKQCPASHKLAMQLSRLGYKNLLEYPVGIAGWKEAGNKVEEAEE